ncbi:hypothetical protein NC651_020002 [Populus alba x Populus x berolinensis]|nr:hypothetical protein NC651_020002 [Populus alba x Populus x berolinensis]
MTAGETLGFNWHHKPICKSSGYPDSLWQLHSSLEPLKIVERNIANNKLCYIILSTMALLWEFSPHLWFSKPQEDKTQ